MNANTNTNTNPHPHTQQHNHADLEQSISDLVGLGRVWARYGLEAGSRALETSSKSLKVTSQFLQKLSDQIEATAEAAKEPVAPASNEKVEEKAEDKIVDAEVVDPT